MAEQNSGDNSRPGLLEVVQKAGEVVGKVVTAVLSVGAVVTLFTGGNKK